TDAARSDLQPPALLDVSGVCVSFGGIVALDGLSLDVPEGRITGLIGPNGAGKTTLFNCVSRLYDCQRGRIRFGGTDITRLPRHRVAAMGMGRTFQNLALFDSLSVMDNVLVGQHSRLRSGWLAHALRLPRVAREERDAHARALELLQLLELDSVAGV